MNINEIKQVLINKLNLDELIVHGNSNHFQIIAVSNMFKGMSQIKQQQVIYEPLMEYIADNRIHALSIKAYTPEEWIRYRKLKSF
ncbi:MAG: BolA family protein [Candidatus Arsenophonus melophagi]|nr:BolA family protein [Candidatus Arsenophonus melophagi]